nr:hypothetical protein [Kineosporia babensis]
MPVAMLQDDFTARFTSIFEEVADTLRQSTDNIGRAADLSVTPDPVVPWLGSWIAAPADPEEGSYDLRERDWVSTQGRALSARGTRTGLQEILQELSGGYPVEIIDGGGIYREGQCPPESQGWVQIRMPLPGRAEPEHVLELIRAEVPIGIDVELLVVPTPDDPPEAFAEPLRLPRRSEPAIEPQTYAAVPGGPYFWDGGTGDVYPPLREDVEPAVVETPDPGLPDVIRRLPGTGGLAVRPDWICPACAEPGDSREPACRRCNSPRKPVPVPAAPVPEPEAEEPPLWSQEPWEDEEPRRIPVSDLLMAGLLLALVVAGFLIFGR